MVLMFEVFICFVVVLHRSCIDMVIIVFPSLTSNNYHKKYMSAD